MDTIAPSIVLISAGVSGSVAGPAADQATQYGLGGIIVMAHMSGDKQGLAKVTFITNVKNSKLLVLSLLSGFGFKYVRKVKTPTPQGRDGI